MSLELTLDETKDYFIFADVCADGQVSSYPVAYLQWHENDLYVIHGFGRDLFNAFSVNSDGSNLSRTIVVHINDTINGNLVADSKWIRFHAVEWNVRYGYSIEQDIGGFYFISIFDNFNRQGIPQKLHDAIDSLHNTTVPQLNKTFKTDAADIFSRQYQKMFVPVSVKNETKNIEKTQETQGGMLVWSPSEYSEGDVMKVKARIFTTVSEGEYVSDDGMLVEVAGFESDLSGGGIIPEGEIEKIFSVNTYNAGLGRVTISMEVEGNVDFERQVPSADLLTGLIGHWDFGDGTSLVMTSRGGSGWSGGTASPNLLRQSNTTPITAGKIGGGFSAPSNGHVTTESGIGYIPNGRAKYMTNTLSGGFSVWVKPSSGSLTGTKKIITAAVFIPVQAQYTNSNLIVASVDGVVSVYVDGFQQYNLSGGFLTEGEWSHIAVGWDASAHEISLFVDGNLVGRSDTLVLGKDTPGYFGTGRIGIGVVDGLTGLFDEVSVWSGRTITQAEVTALFNGGAGLPYEEWT